MALQTVKITKMKSYQPAVPMTLTSLIMMKRDVVKTLAISSVIRIIVSQWLATVMALDNVKITKMKY